MTSRPRIFFAKILALAVRGGEAAAKTNRYTDASIMHLRFFHFQKGMAQ